MTFIRSLAAVGAVTVTGTVLGQTVAYSNLSVTNTRDSQYMYSCSLGIFPDARAELAWSLVPGRSGEVTAGRFALYRETSNAQAVFSVYEENQPAGGPGALLGTWTFALPADPSNTSTYVLPLPGGVRVEANRRYYFAVKAVNNGWWRWFAAPRLATGQFPTCTIAQRPGTGGAWDVYENSNPPAFALEVQPCGSADFNGDGDVGTDQDIEAFFACLAGTCCGTCFAGGSDFNGDGDFGTDADIEGFFRVLAGAAC